MCDEMRYMGNLYTLRPSHPSMNRVRSQRLRCARLQSAPLTGGAGAWRNGRRPPCQGLRT